jgi:hypothetical protein
MRVCLNNTGPGMVSLISSETSSSNGMSSNKAMKAEITSKDRFKGNNSLWF